MTRLIGARRLQVDRLDYLQALGDSWKDQVLYNIVKLRYHDAPTFLDITQISQTYQLQTAVSAGYQYGGNPTTVTSKTENTTIKRSDVFEYFRHGVSAGISGQYQTTPTISYQPISGEALKESLLKPIPTDDLCRALETNWEPNFILPYIVESINNLENKTQNQDFLTLIEIWQKLSKAGVLRLAFEEVKEVKTPEISKQDNEAKAKTDKWGEGAENLAKFTSTLVKAQDKESAKKTIAPFLILNWNIARGLEKKEELEQLKKLLGLLGSEDSPQLSEESRQLKNKTICLLKDEHFDQNQQVLKWLKKEAKLTEKQITDNKKAIAEFLGLVPAGLTPPEQAHLKKLITNESPQDIEKYQIVSGVPPKTKGLSKIYLSTRSVTQVLILLSKFVEVPKVHLDAGYVKEADAGWVGKGIPRITVFNMGTGGPDILTRPDSFASVKYKGFWFYILDNDRNSKDILSSMIAIFTMMPTGEKEKPVLTLPVR